MLTTLHRGMFLAGASLLMVLLSVAAGCGDDETTGASSSGSNDSGGPGPGNDGGGADGSKVEDGAVGDGATDASTDFDAAGQEQMICDALASRASCPSGAAEPCDDSDKCIYGKVMLPAAASVYASCRGAPSCKGDDTCVYEAAKAVGGAAADKYGTDCIARRTACSNSFKDDYCFPGVFAYPNAGAAAQACLAQACDQIGACIANLQAFKDIAACKK